jgi:hypothetical protein
VNALSSAATKACTVFSDRQLGRRQPHQPPHDGMADELGMRPLVAHCHHGLGKLYRRTGKREQAQEHVTTATTMYREMGMTYWLEQAEAELNALR